MDQWAALMLQIHAGTVRVEARYTQNSHRLTCCQPLRRHFRRVWGTPSVFLSFVRGQVSLLSPTAPRGHSHVHQRLSFRPSRGAVDEGWPHPATRGRSEAGPACWLQSWPAAVLGCHPGTHSWSAAPFDL